LLFLFFFENLATVKKELLENELLENEIVEYIAVDELVVVLAIDHRSLAEIITPSLQQLPSINGLKIEGSSKSWSHSTLSNTATTNTSMVSIFDFVKKSEKKKRDENNSIK
jgi:hypothetical protein